MNVQKKQQIISRCNKLADFFLTSATEFKALSRSIERTTDRKELDNILNFLKKRMDILSPAFEEMRVKK